MDILPFGYIDGLKRYWRRRKYRKLDDSVKARRKIKIARLGRKNGKDQKELKPNKAQGFKLMAPTKLVTRLHEAYADAMIRLGGTKRIDCVKNEAKRAAKCQPIPMLSTPRNEMVDYRIVLEMYKKIVCVKNEAKRAAKCQPIPMLSTPRNEMVDYRIVLEMYKKIVCN